MKIFHSAHKRTLLLTDTCLRSKLHHMNQTLLKSLDATLGPVLCRMLGWVKRAPSTQIPADIKRILLIRPGGIGDMIILLPVIKILKQKYPDAQIDIACQERNKPVLALAGLECKAITFDSQPFSFIGHLKNTSYDICIDSEQFHHFSAVFSLISAAPVRIGFNINPKRNPLYTHLINYSNEGAEGEQFMNLIQPVLNKYSEPYCLEHSITADPEQARGLVDGIESYAVMHPCGSTSYKHWPAAHFAAVISHLQKHHGLRTILCGNRDDIEACSEIVEHEPTAISLAGQTSLAAAAALLAEAKIFLGTDSALSHLASAVGTRSVTLFGPGDHRKWGHDNAGNVVIHKGLPCSPCFIFGAHKPCTTKECMHDITTDEVIRACDRAME